MFQTGTANLGKMTKDSNHYSKTTLDYHPADITKVNKVKNKNSI
jgi:hypothetical protein